jgi:Flp pilus assembly protein TadG
MNHDSIERTMKQQRSFSGIFRRLAKDREGMGAVEFAIIVPILLMVYITSFELTIGLSVAKRATRASGSIADIVTQQTSVNKAYLKTMINAADGIFEPYGITGLKLKITGISIDASSKPTVAWSWAQDDSRPYAVGAAVTIPSALTVANTFLVRSELTIPHELLMFMPSVMPPQVKTVNISREDFFRQRAGTTLACTNC